jgi:acetylornithine deacetylase/succinyl-diaminopimelate desuccinylase-like protein
LDVLTEIEGLSSDGGRRAGSDAERRAAGRVEELLREMGREVEVESIDIYPRWAVVHTIHALLAIAGSLVSVASPIIGAALVLIATLSAFGDASGLFRPLRRLTGRRASQNVLSREGGDERAGQIVLVAHLDSSRGGALFGRAVQERLAVVGGRLKRTIGPFVPFMAALLVLLVCCIARLFGQQGNILTAFQLLPTIVLIIAVVALLDTALSKTVPGANDNASGVATVLRLAERFGGKLEHFGIWVLITGGQESFGLGMKAFLKKHKEELDKERTVFINVDEVGSGTVRYGQREGVLLPGKSHPQLFEIAEQIAEDDGEDGAYSAKPLELRTPTDASVARLAGYPAITIACRNAIGYVPHHHQPSDTVDNIDDEALERAYGFTAELIERLDGEIGPDLTRSETRLAEDDSEA